LVGFFAGTGVWRKHGFLPIHKDGILRVRVKLKLEESINNSFSTFQTQWVHGFGICWGQLALLCDE